MFRQLLYRDIYLVPIICGFFIQCLKVILYSIVNRKNNLFRLVQADGMPNLHSAVFSSLSTGVGIKYGMSSILFSLVTTYSVIIIYDTMKLKSERGKQASILNRILSSLQWYDEIESGKGIRVLQFRPFDVMSGAVLGMLIAFMML
jgi:acid phosphatase family membrane protein YuiD